MHPSATHIVALQEQESTMMRVLFRGLTLSLTLCALSLFGAGLSFGQDKKVSVRSVARPLRLVLEDISKQTGTALRADKFLADKKLICFVNDARESALLDEIAAVVGADVVRTTEKSGPQVLIRRKEEVSTWFFRYRTARQYARRVASQRLADRIYDADLSIIGAMERAASAAGQTKPGGTPPISYTPDRNPPPPADALPLIRLLPKSAWRTLAQAHAEGYADQIGALRAAGNSPLVAVPFAGLTPDGKILVRSLLDSAAGNPKTQAWSESDASVRIVTESGFGASIEVAAQKAGEEFPMVGVHKMMQLGGYGMESERLALEREEVGRRLADTALPPSACLGFTVEKDGMCKVPVALDPKARLNDPAIKADDFSRAELLEELGKKLKRNVVSDYYTDDRRIGAFDGKSSDLLAKGAERFNCVFREKDGFLLSCVTDAAAQDELEAPYPLFEQCIEWNQKQRDKVSELRLLPIELYLAVCALPHERFLKIARYDDKKTGVKFVRFASDLQFDNSGYPWYVRYGLLNAHLTRMVSAEGMPFAEASPELQRSVRTDVTVRSFFNGPVPPGAILRMRYVSLPLDDGREPEPFDNSWDFQLHSAGGKFVDFSVASLFAAPPTQRTDKKADGK